MGGTALWVGAFSICVGIALVVYLFHRFGRYELREIRNQEINREQEDRRTNGVSEYDLSESQHCWIRHGHDIELAHPSATHLVAHHHSNPTPSSSRNPTRQAGWFHRHSRATSSWIVRPSIERALGHKIGKSKTRDEEGFLERERVARKPRSLNEEARNRDPEASSSESDSDSLDGFSQDRDGAHEERMARVK
ncbi:hypothetical protein T439DRAFT_142010 [Meredithblackwellia eburnea MCA 4105]